jgi:Flp pilus assembly pilin Flp
VADKKGGNMKRIQGIMNQLIQDESGQGVTEYILLLVIVVGLAMLFKGPLGTMVNQKLSDLSSALQGVTTSLN